MALKKLHGLNESYLDTLLIAAKLYNVGQEIGFTAIIKTQPTSS